MGSLTLKLLYILIVLSIAADFLNLGSSWLNGNQHGEEISAQSSSQFLPGAYGWIGPVARAVARGLARGAKRRSGRRSGGGAEHTKNKRKSTKDKHERGQARKDRDQKRAEERRKKG